MDDTRKTRITFEQLSKLRKLSDIKAAEYPRIIKEIRRHLIPFVQKLDEILISLLFEPKSTHFIANFQLKLNKTTNVQNNNLFHTKYNRSDECQKTITNLNN